MYFLYYSLYVICFINESDHNNIANYLFLWYTNISYLQLLSLSLSLSRFRFISLVAFFLISFDSFASFPSLRFYPIPVLTSPYYVNFIPI